MSSRLWGAYFENEWERFKGLLGLPEDGSGGAYDVGSSSLTNDATFDSLSPPRKQSTSAVNILTNSTTGSKAVLNRFQLNSRLPANTIANPLAPATGLTILQHAA